MLGTLPDWERLKWEIGQMFTRLRQAWKKRFQVAEYQFKPTDVDHMNLAEAIEAAEKNCPSSKPVDQAKLDLAPKQT